MNTRAAATCCTIVTSRTVRDTGPLAPVSVITDQVMTGEATVASAPRAMATVSASSKG